MAITIDAIKSNIYQWLMDEIAAHEGGGTITFTYDDATFEYIIYKPRYKAANITLGSGRSLIEALKQAMERSAALKAQ